MIIIGFIIYFTLWKPNWIKEIIKKGFIVADLNLEFDETGSIKKNYGLKIVDAKMIGDDIKIIYIRNAN